MQARSLVINTLLLDLTNAFLLLLERKHKYPALLNMYSFIDICAALANDGETNNRVIFERYVRGLPMMSGKPFSPYDLWAARSALLHAYSPLGHHTAKSDAARPIFYYSWPERREEAEGVLRAKGYGGFILLEVEDVKWVAIDALAWLQHRVETNAAFESRFLSNAQHFLFDLQSFKLESELSLLEELDRKRRENA